MGTKPILLYLMLFWNFCHCLSSTTSNTAVEPIDQWTMIAGMVVIVFLAMLSIIAGLLWKIYQLTLEKEKRKSPRRHKTKKCKVRAPPDSTPNCSEIDVERGKLFTADSLDIEQNFRMNRNLIDNLKIIEACKYSILQKGQLKMVKPKNDKDATKRLEVMVRSALHPDDCTQQKLIEHELKILCEIEGHPNILPLIGFIEDRNLLSIITEYPEGGNLRDYVKKFKAGFGMLNVLKGGCAFKNRLTLARTGYNVYESTLDSKLASLCTFDLLSFAYQIAKGMRHMANNSYYHRQLSLHNIFITSNKTIRIGNFSLTRSRENNEYYRARTEFEFTETHIAPEAVDEKRFTERSDVWSYGISLWELFTLGKTPYEKEPEVLKFVNNGGRLKMPDNCHPEIYVFMRKCWNTQSFCRPTFVDCVEFFEQHFQRYNIQIMGQINEKLNVASEYQASLEEWRNGEENIDC